jgi:hypothetical protein
MRDGVRLLALETKTRASPPALPLWHGVRGRSQDDAPLPDPARGRAEVSGKFQIVHLNRRPAQCPGGRRPRKQHRPAAQSRAGLGMAARRPSSVAERNRSPAATPALTERMPNGVRHFNIFAAGTSNRFSSPRVQKRWARNPPCAGLEWQDGTDNAKRRQIMAGAREVFLAQGFDAASIGEIARTAGVLKGTLYVYLRLFR